MAKHLLLFAVGALAFTACTSEEVVDDASATRSAIKFENVVNKHTRADIISEELTHFNVFGFYTMPGNPQHAHQVFYNVPVDKESGAWKYEGGERYWIPDAKYYFYAYSCGNIQINQQKYPATTYSMDMDGEKGADQRVLEIRGYICDETHQHDLIFASNTGAVEGNTFAGIKGDKDHNEDVLLQFSHILSKVRARFTTQFPTEYEIVISDVSIQDLRNQGNFDVVNGWHAVTRSGDNPYVRLLPETGSIMVKNATVDADGKKVQLSAATNQAYVLPNGSDDAKNTTVSKEVSIKFTMDVYVGADRTDKVMSKTLTGTFTPDWQENHLYVYNIDINGSTTHMQVISFTTTVDEFGKETGGEAETEISEFEVVDNPVNA